MARATQNALDREAAANVPQGEAISAADLDRDLRGLRDLLGMAAMAVEADRVLSDLDVWAPLDPQLGRRLETIDAWRQWTEHRASLGGALAYMQHIVDRCIE